MSLCVLCAQPTLGSGDLCPYHTAGQGDEWAAGNRVMCDFVHRGLVGTTPHDVADPSIELLDNSLEVVLTASATQGGSWFAAGVRAFGNE